MLALPRIWVFDGDRTARLAAMLATACPLHTEEK
jgi:hypothetical protein